MLLGCSPVLGQTDGSIVSGQVRTPKGGPTGSIAVILTGLSPNNRISIRTQTNDDGFFRFPNVRPGEYTVFAGAFVTTLLPETIDALQVIVNTSMPGILLGSSGTYYPGTADVSTANAIAVTAGAAAENVNFPLAAGTLSWSGPTFRTVPVKMVVEDGGTPTFHSDQLSLTFSDTPANVSASVTFQGGARKPAAPLIRVERIREPFLSTSIIPMPGFPESDFRLALPEGTIGVGVLAPIKPATGTSSRAGMPARSYYYIKSMTFGATDLMKGLMTLRAPVADTLVITLARCTGATTQEPLCR